MDSWTLLKGRGKDRTTQEFRGWISAVVGSDVCEGEVSCLTVVPRQWRTKRWPRQFQDEINSFLIMSIPQRLKTDADHERGLWLMCYQPTSGLLAMNCVAPGMRMKFTSSRNLRGHHEVEIPQCIKIPLAKNLEEDSVCGLGRSWEAKVNRFTSPVPEGQLPKARVVRNRILTPHPWCISWCIHNSSLQHFLTTYFTVQSSLSCDLLKNFVRLKIG